MAREDSIDVICNIRMRELFNGFSAIFLETEVLGNISTIYFSIGYAFYSMTPHLLTVLIQVDVRQNRGQRTALQ